MRSIVFTLAATRQWTKLSATVRVRLRKRLEAFAATGQGDIKALKGRSGMRLRVGDWRVIFYVDGDTIVVVAVGHRRDIYD
ncbi:MAG: type II toxin-antitoxin system RelE/ParE family toxin [Xanthobacteraceae bacterium]